MKIKFTNYYTYLFGVLILLGALSCQTETLDSYQSLSDSDSFNKKNTNKVPERVWPSCEAEPSSIVTLVAGQNIPVGTVEVKEVGLNYEITFKIYDDMDFCMSSTHVSVVNEKNEFPMTQSGNPIPGQFEFSESHDCVKSYTYTVPNKGDYIAAHAVVNCTSGAGESIYEEFMANLPSSVNVCVTAKPGTNSYFNIQIAAENSLTGSFGAWCLDFDTHLNNGECFDADVYTVFDDLSGVQLDNEETIGAINWILNQDFIGSGYTFGEIQFALWKFIEGAEIDGAWLGTYDPEKGREIYNLALEHLDYTPECGDLLGIILMPQINTIQPIIIGVPFECTEVQECEETAMAAGCSFPGDNWFTYFQYGESQD